MEETFKGQALPPEHHLRQPVPCPYDSLDPAHLAHHPVLAAEIERLGNMYEEERWGDDR